MQADAILQRVTAAFDALLQAARPYDGLFPSVIDRDTGKMRMDEPEPIPGQRYGDRAHRGSNLMHDHPILAAMVALSQTGERADYAEAADAYLRHFAEHCTDTPTGLLPWGEHAFWDLVNDKPGSSQIFRKNDRPAVHDHLLQAPWWLWEKLWQFNPDAVKRFAAGLDWHWRDEQRTEFNRHAPLLQAERWAPESGSADFPRHAGFYIFDLAFAWKRTRDDVLHEQLQRFVDHHWQRRMEGDLLSLATRPPSWSKTRRHPDPTQTLSLGVSLLEAAEQLDDADPPLAATMRERGRTYVNAFLRAYDPNEGLVWGSVYGQSKTSMAAFGLLALCAYRRLPDDVRLVELARRIGLMCYYAPLPTGEMRVRTPETEAYLRVHEHRPIPVLDAGLVLELLADLYDVTAHRAWLDCAMIRCDELSAAYLDKPLPRGATGIERYESQLRPGVLLHALTRIALLDRCGREGCPLAPDYTTR